MLTEDQMEFSILAHIGKAICWIFAPLGWGDWQATVAAVTGLVAKENIVATMGILYGGGDGTVYANIAAAFTAVSGMSFLVFNLLCAPCFAAMGAIKREMNSAKWFWFAIGYQCGLACCHYCNRTDYFHAGSPVQGKQQAGCKSKGITKHPYIRRHFYGQYRYWNSIAGHSSRNCLEVEK